MAVQGTVIHRPWVRKTGPFVLVAGGVVLMKLCVLDVLNHARDHADSVSLSFKGVVLAPTILLFGIALIPASRRPAGTVGSFQRRMTNQQTQRLNAFGWMVVLLFLVPGAALYVWLRSQLAALGYDV